MHGYRCLTFLSCASDHELGTTLPSPVSAVGGAVAVLDVGIAEADERDRAADTYRQLVVGGAVHNAVAICQFNGDKSKILTVGLERCAIGCQADGLDFISSL